MADSNGRDRRKSPRKTLKFNVSFDNIEETETLPVTALNLSASGLYCISDKSIGELTRLDLVMDLNNNESIKARAVVIREEPLSNGKYGLGLFFTSILDTDRARISAIAASEAELTRE